MTTINQAPGIVSSDTKKTFAFPFQLGPSGFPAMAADNQAVYNSILSLLMTGKGDRVMRPDFGVDIHSLIFDNLTPLLQARIATNVTRAIETYEPRAAVIAIDTRTGLRASGEDTAVFVDILYRVVGQQSDQQISVELPGNL